MTLVFTVLTLFHFLGLSAGPTLTWTYSIYDGYLTEYVCLQLLLTLFV